MKRTWAGREPKSMLHFMGHVAAGKPRWNAAWSRLRWGGWRSGECFARQPIGACDRDRPEPWHKTEAITRNAKLDCSASD